MVVDTVKPGSWLAAMSKTPEEMAREIAEHIWDILEDFDGGLTNHVKVCVPLIAAALTEYGEAIKDDIRTNGIGKYELDKADAEGYRRGVEEASDIAYDAQDDSNVEIFRRIKKLLQRGTGGGE